MLVKDSKVDLIEIVGEHRIIQYRESEVVLENGVAISEPKYKRFVVVPGQVVTDLPESVIPLVEVLHTPEVISSYEAHMQEQLQKYADTAEGGV